MIGLASVLSHLTTLTLTWSLVLEVHASSKPNSLSRKATLTIVVRNKSPLLMMIVTKTRRRLPRDPLA